MANNWKFGLGLLAGAAAGYWLNTAEGRRFRKRAQQQFNEASEQAGQYIAETSQQLDKNVTEYKSKGQAFLEDSKNKVQQKTDQIKAAVIHKQSNRDEAYESHYGLKPVHPDSWYFFWVVGKYLNGKSKNNIGCES